MESRNVMKKYIGILAKITGFILIVILAVNIIPAFHVFLFI